MPIYIKPLSDNGKYTVTADRPEELDLAAKLYQARVVTKNHERRFEITPRQRMLQSFREGLSATTVTVKKSEQTPKAELKTTYALKQERRRREFIATGGVRAKPVVVNTGGTPSLTPQ